MEILYSGAVKEGADQLNADQSLGGIVSGSNIPNDQLSNLFSTASLLSIQNKRREIKMLIIKNNDGDITKNLKFKFNLDTDSICNYKVAFVFPKITSTGACFEQIPNSSSLPYYANFSNIANNTEFIINELNNGAYLGLWLMREYNYESLELKKKTTEDWLAELALIDANNGDPIDINIQENFSFILSYSVGESSTSSSTSNSNSNHFAANVSEGSLIITGTSPHLLPGTTVQIVVDGNVIETIKVSE